MKYHPDKAGKDPSAESKFKDISEAYETLSDPSEEGFTMIIQILLERV
jgi:DnaJ-class molecular chaperone